MRQRGGETGTHRVPVMPANERAGQEHSSALPLLLGFLCFALSSFFEFRQFRPSFPLTQRAPPSSSYPPSYACLRLRAHFLPFPLSPLPLSPIWDARVAWPRALVLRTVRSTVGGTRTDQVTPHFVCSETPFCACHLQADVQGKRDEDKKAEVRYKTGAIYGQLAGATRVEAAGPIQELQGAQSALT